MPLSCSYSHVLHVYALFMPVHAPTLQRGSEVGSAAFDKDDDLAVEFVTAASNLRSLCYDIPVQV